MTKKISDFLSLDNRTVELLELVRLLEHKDYFDKDLLKNITDTAKKTTGTPFNKLVYRATLLDDSYKLGIALQQVHGSIAILARIWTWGYFILGITLVFGLLALPVINFFYLFIALLGWHTLSLILWLVTTCQNKPSVIGSMVTFFVNKFTPTDLVHETAYKIIMSARQSTWHLYISSLLHKACLMGLLGNLIGLFGLLLIKKYTFTWQSTLLDNDHLITLLTVISYLPSLLLSTVINMPALDEHIINHSRILGLLALTSLIVYGVIPRALALAYTTHRSKYDIRLDKTLYYYENLLRMFRHSIIDPDDHQPATPKPIVMTADKITAHKLIATFENAYEPFWYQYKAGNDITDVGTIDTKADFVRLQTAIQSYKATVYLGINTAILPDRGVIRKLKQVQAISTFGLVAELLGESEHRNAWRAVLTECHIMESR